MSNEALRRARHVTAPITGTQHHVLFVLADFANESMMAWPAQSTLAAVCHRPRSVVQDALFGLEFLGLIERCGRVRRVVRYRLCLPQPHAPFEPAKGPPTGQSVPDSVTASRSHTDRPPVSVKPAHRSVSDRPPVIEASESPKEPSGKRRGAPKRPPEADAILDSFCQATGSESRRWPTSCSKAVEHYRGTEFEITPERVALVAANKATWMTGGVALSSILRTHGKMPWDSSLEQAEIWDAKGRPSTNSNSGLSPEDQSRIDGFEGY